MSNGNPKPKRARPHDTKNKSPRDELNVRQATYIKNVMEGKSKYQSALLAGYPKSMAKIASDTIEGDNVRAAFTELMRKKIPLEKIADTMAGGMDATKVIYSTLDGRITDMRDLPDHTERRKHAQLAAEMSSAWVPKAEIETTKKMDAETVKRLLDLTARLDIASLPPEKQAELRKSHVTLTIEATPVSRETCSTPRRAATKNKARSAAALGRVLCKVGCEALHASRQQVEPVERRIFESFSQKDLELLRKLLLRFIAALGAE